MRRDDALSADAGVITPGYPDQISSSASGPTIRPSATSSVFPRICCSRRAAMSGFSLSQTAGSFIVVPQTASVSRDWVSARSAISGVREVVDLLNDEDRLLGE